MTAHAAKPILEGGTIRWIEHFRLKWDVPGIGLAVVASPKFTEDGEWRKDTHTFGMATLDGRPITPDTYFAVGSNSKLFAAIAFGLLVKDETLLPNGKKLDWKTKAKSAFPRWTLQDKIAEQLIDMTDLLSMQSGLPRHDFACATSADQALDNLALLKPSSELRQSWQYNNYHYHILATLYPHLACTTYEDFVQQRIFDPLGMTDASFDSAKVGSTGRRTDGHFRTGLDPQACKRLWQQDSALNDNLARRCRGHVESLGWWTEDDGLFLSGAGGLMLTPRDMTKWLAELLSPQVISADLIEHVTTPVALSPLGNTGAQPEMSSSLYGMGQHIYKYRGHRVHRHDGSLNGQQSRLVWLPDDGLAIMIAINEEHIGEIAIAIIVNTIVDKLLGLDRVDWEERLMKPFLTVTHDDENPACKDVMFLVCKDVEETEDGKGIVDAVFQAPAYPHLHFRHMDSFPRATYQAIHAALAELACSTPLDLNSVPWVTEYPSTFNTHLVLLACNRSVGVYHWIMVNVPLTTSRDGRSKGATVGASGKCVVTRRGMGMFGNFWGSDGPCRDVEVDELAAQRKAEVWFEKKAI